MAKFNPQREAKTLLAMFKPEVLEVLKANWINWEVGIKYVSYSERAAMHMYHLVLKPLPHKYAGTNMTDEVGIPVFNLQKDICAAVDKFCTWPNEGVEYKGFKFFVGDGDDSLAVQFYADGTFHVWLRGWAMQQ